MPVDIAARAVLELIRVKNGNPTEQNPDQSDSTVYHVQNSKIFHWTNDLLPALHEAGLEFETVPQREWVRRLRESDNDPKRNPTIKLLDFFTEKYDNDKPGRKELTFDTTKTSKESKTIAEGYDIIGSGIIKKFVTSWRSEW